MPTGFNITLLYYVVGSFDKKEEKGRRSLS